MTGLRDRFIGDLRLRGLWERTVKACVSAVLGLGQARTPALPPARLPPPTPLPTPPRAHVQGCRPPLPRSLLRLALPLGRPRRGRRLRPPRPPLPRPLPPPRRLLQPLHRGVRRLDRHLPLDRLPLRSPAPLHPPGRPLHRPLPPARPPLRLRQGPRLRPARPPRARLEAAHRLLEGHRNALGGRAVLQPAKTDPEAPNPRPFPLCPRCKLGRMVPVAVILRPRPPP